MNTHGPTLCAMIRLTHLFRTLVAASLLLLCLSGCEDKRRHQASEEVSFPSVPPPVGKDTGAEETALALLDAMKSLQSIRAVGFGVEGHKEKYDQAMGLIASLMDKHAVYEKVVVERSPSVPRDISQDAATRLIAEAWVSTVAHYLDGIDAGSKSSVSFKQGETITSPHRRLERDGTIKKYSSRKLETDEAIVYVYAENPEERRQLEEIEGGPDVRRAAGPDGKPLEKGSPAYLAKIRGITIPRGFNVPIGVRIAIRLKQTPDGWRAMSLRLEAPKTQMASALAE